jgi:glycosyltransferase involved in cell wall biosynthesis
MLRLIKYVRSSRSMKISFVVPAYNEEDYLGPCLESIISQIKEVGCHAEVIVVNNASVDGTRRVAKRYSGVVLVDESQKGLSRARQAGFNVSSGELIANIDADGRLPNGWIQTVLDAFAEDAELVALSGPHIFYDVPQRINYWVKAFNCLTFAAYFANRFIFCKSSFLQGGNYIIRREALLKIGGFRPQFEFYGEDADVAYRLHKIGKVKFTFDLPLFASGRRVMTEGKFTVAWRYGVNYFSTIFLRRPFNEEHEDIRLPNEGKKSRE